jgi:hypothetical protein
VWHGGFWTGKPPPLWINSLWILRAFHWSTQFTHVSPLPTSRFACAPIQSTRSSSRQLWHALTKCCSFAIIFVVFGRRRLPINGPCASQSCTWITPLRKLGLLPSTLSIPSHPRGHPIERTCRAKFYESVCAHIVTTFKDAFVPTHIWHAWSHTNTSKSDNLNIYKTYVYGEKLIHNLRP